MEEKARVGWTRVAGILAIAAGVIHGGLAPSHLEEWWGYGLFFLAAALAQVILGMALIFDAVPNDRARRAIHLGGAFGTLLILAMYVVSRTIGVPFAGPAQGEVEEVDPLGLVTFVTEVVTAVLLVATIVPRSNAVT